MAEEDNKPAPTEEEAQQKEEKRQADTGSADVISEGSNDTKPQAPSAEDLGIEVNDEGSTEVVEDENKALSEALLSEAEEEQEEASASELEDEGVEEEAEAPSLKEQANALKEEVANARAGATTLGDLDMLEYLEHLWMLYADFSISILSPLIPPISPPIIVTPAVKDDGRVERVFYISDEGFRLTTSRGEEAYVLGQSMFKYFNTIEKMIKLLVERLKTGGIDKDTEVRVAFLGFELGQRKAFESILNLEENVVVTNYDPGEWGDRFMKNILEMAERGYGLPSSSPRTKF